MFQTIQFNISMQFKISKYFYSKLFSLVNKVKCIKNIAVYHKEFN